MDLTFLVAGVLLLFLGRKLFWLFVAVVGFLIGMTYAPQLLPSQPQSVILTISLIAGLLGALLAALLQKLAVGLAGFAAGGYIVYYLLQFVAVNFGEYQWMAILAGAIIGALLAGSMFDWALILLTSASGSTLISQGLNLSMPLSAVVLAGLFVFGIVVQGNIKAKE
ncbi:MAG TPA: DUF4203 domain-containing protein [Pelolinea sp.]|nr:DUF4203 domain-containing protein [Pelolinea sp.]